VKTDLTFGSLVLFSHVCERLERRVDPSTALHLTVLLR